MRLFKEARKFVIKQRIKELENALRHWPDSIHAEERSQQLLSFRIELVDIDEEK